MSYRETFVTLPVTTTEGDEEITLPAHKVKIIRGGAKVTTLTYEDGDTIARASVPLGAKEVRERVLAAMVDWS